MHLESSRLKYRESNASDVALLLKLELEDDNLKYICSSTEEQHLSFIGSQDFLHLLVTDQNNVTIGFILLAGLNERHKSLELRRIVITQKGKGYGREAIRRIMKYCFIQLRYHRLWLDVFDFNHRAIELYRSEGFKEEGILRESVYKDGKYRSLILLSMLEQEYFTP